jgi:hypothetical protein
LAFSHLNVVVQILPRQIHVPTLPIDQVQTERQLGRQVQVALVLLHQLVATLQRLLVVMLGQIGHVHLVVQPAHVVEHLLRGLRLPQLPVLLHKRNRLRQQAVLLVRVLLAGDLDERDRDQQRDERIRVLFVELQVLVDGVLERARRQTVVGLHQPHHGRHLVAVAGPHQVAVVARIVRDQDDDVEEIPQLVVAQIVAQTLADHVVAQVGVAVVDAGQQAQELQVFGVARVEALRRLRREQQLGQHPVLAHVVGRLAEVQEEGPLRVQRDFAAGFGEFRHVDVFEGFTARFAGFAQRLHAVAVALEGGDRLNFGAVAQFGAMAQNQLVAVVQVLGQAGHLLQHETAFVEKAGVEQFHVGVLLERGQRLFHPALVLEQRRKRHAGVYVLGQVHHIRVRGDGHVYVADGAVAVGVAQPNGGQAGKRKNSNFSRLVEEQVSSRAL